MLLSHQDYGEPSNNQVLCMSGLPRSPCSRRNSSLQRRNSATTRRNSAVPRSDDDTFKVDVQLPFSVQPGTKLRVPFLFNGVTEKMVVAVPPNALEGATLTVRLSKAWLVKRAQAREKAHAAFAAI